MSIAKSGAAARPPLREARAGGCDFLGLPTFRWIAALVVRAKEQDDAIAITHDRTPAPASPLRGAWTRIDRRRPACRRASRKRRCRAAPGSRALRCPPWSGQSDSTLPWASRGPAGGRYRLRRIPGCTSLRSVARLYPWRRLIRRARQGTLRGNPAHGS